MKRRQRFRKSPSPPRRIRKRNFSIRVPNPEKTLAKKKRIEEYQRKEALIVQLIEEMLRPELPPKKLSKEEKEFYSLLSEVFFKNAQEGFEQSVYNHDGVGSDQILKSFTNDIDEDLEDDISQSIITSRNQHHRPNPLYSRYLREMMEYKEMGRKFLKEFNLVYLFENVYLSRDPIKKFEPEECGCVRRCDENCINRLMKFECVGCKLGENCGNDSFQRRRWKSTSIEKAGLKGHGLFPNEDIKKGSFVIEYVGEILNTEQLRDRKEKYQRHCYFFSLGNDLAIDASLKGNQARFINHSCNPNLEPQKWFVDGEYRIGFFAKKDIPKGTELSFDYSFETFTEYKQQCLCGAANCRGYITSKKQRNQMKNGEDIKVLEAVSPTEQLKEVELSSSDGDDDLLPLSGKTIRLNITKNMRTLTVKGKGRRKNKKKKKKKKSKEYNVNDIMKNQEEICQNLVSRIDQISRQYVEQTRKNREMKTKVTTIGAEEDEEDEEEDVYVNEGIEIFDPSRMNRRFILKRNLKRGLMKRILQIHKQRQITPAEDIVPPPPPPPQSLQQEPIPPPPPTPEKGNEVLVDESSDSDVDKEIEALKRTKGKVSPREIRKLQRDRLKHEIEEEEEEEREKERKKKKKMRMKKKKKMKKIEKNVTGKKRKREDLPPESGDGKDKAGGDDDRVKKKRKV